MSEPAIRELQERVALLEQELRQIKSQLRGCDRLAQPEWMKLVGSQAGNPIFQAVVRQIQKNRQADYEATIAEIDAEEEREKKARRAKRAARTD
jgi:hypothetical protein